jgi:integrase
MKTRAGENYLTIAEEKKLLQTLKARKGKQAERDYMLISLGRASGLRRAELAALNVGDVFGKDRLVIHAGIAKKGGIGEIYLNKEIQAQLLRFFRLKKKWGESLDFRAPLFVSRRGNRISVRAINDLMTKWCKQAGIAHYTPHALRHTKARRIMDDRRYLDSDDPARRLLFTQKQLRQKSINSTTIYTAPTKEQMKIVGGV